MRRVARCPLDRAKALGTDGALTRVLVAVVVLAGVAVSPATAQTPATASQTFTPTGSLQSFVVPPGVSSVGIQAAGAAGGGSSAPGGAGALVRADFPVTAGMQLSILVGGRGQFNGPAAGGGGGGGSFVWLGPVLSPDGSNLLIAAGGGGGGSACGDVGKAGLPRQVGQGTGGEGGKGFGSIGGGGGGGGGVAAAGAPGVGVHGGGAPGGQIAAGAAGGLPGGGFGGGGGGGGFSGPAGGGGGGGGGYTGGNGGDGGRACAGGEGGDSFIGRTGQVVRPPVFDPRAPTGNPGEGSVTISFVPPADLTAAVRNDVNGATMPGTSWTWSVRVANVGNGPATFAPGQMMLVDNLPSGLAYAGPTIGNVVDVTGSANINCILNTTTSDLTCFASPVGPVTIGPRGGFDVQITTTASALGTYTNPRPGGTCQVDPNRVIAVAGVVSAICAGDTVAVTTVDLAINKTNNVNGVAAQDAEWIWTLSVTNGGTGPAVFGTGQVVLIDSLPLSNVAYGTPSAPVTSNVLGSENLSCAIVNLTLTCTAGGGPVAIGAGGRLEVSVPARSGIPGTYANPDPDGRCQVDPDNAIPQARAGARTCADTVSVVAPPEAPPEEPPAPEPPEETEAIPSPLTV